MIGRQGHAKVAHPVGTWQQPGQNACVRRIRNRAWRECLREPNSLLRQLIYRGSLDPLVSITPNVVATQRVDGNEKNIPAGYLFTRASAANESGRRQTRIEDKSQDPHDF
jgi:hypothetical protein